MNEIIFLTSANYLYNELKFDYTLAFFNITYLKYTISQSLRYDAIHYTDDSLTLIKFKILLLIFQTRGGTCLTESVLENLFICM